MKLKIQSAKESDVYKDIARIPEAHRKDDNGNPIPSGKICKLTINGKSKYLILRGHDKETGPVLFLDESCREKLCVQAGDEVEACVRYAPRGILKWWNEIRWAWDATDPSYRLPVKISVVLGILGVVLGIISILPLAISWLSR